MALTPAERKRNHIEKLKATGKYDDFKKKRAAYERIRQERRKRALEQLPKAVREETERLKREYNRKKAAKCRLRKKNAKINTLEDTRPIPSVTATAQSIEPYKTTSALSKTVAKLKRALPSCSAQQKVVAKMFLGSFDENDKTEMVNDVMSPKSVKGTSRLKSDVVDAIKAFYERDDISRISPSIRDSRKFTDPVTGVEEVKQIRYLMFKLSDVHKMFVQKGIQPVRLSKFSSLRPAYVKLVASTTLDQCLCFHHTNFIMCCKAINVNLPQFPAYGPQLELLLLCDIPRKDCWFRVCKKCPNAKRTLFDMVKQLGKSGKAPVTLCQWRRNNETNRFQKYVENGTLNTLINHFLDIVPEFLKHSFVKRQQSPQFQRDDKEIRESNGRVALCQIDFAEAFNCESQDQIQSAHWNQATV